MVWWWPDVRELIKRWYLDTCGVYICLFGYLIFVMIHVVFISSPYLLVFGDDSVCGTREQIMLMQVEPVRLSRGVVFYWGNFLYFL